MKRPVLVRRHRPLRGGQPLAFAVGLILALAVGAVLLMAADHEPLRVYQRMFEKSLGDQNAWSLTLNRAVPLGLAGLAVAVAGSMGLWNIGAEGQILAGAMGAAWVARIGGTWPGPMLLTGMLVGAVIGGGLLALVPAMARAMAGTRASRPPPMTAPTSIPVRSIGPGQVPPMRATQAAPMAPARICPSAPMFQSPIEPATATASPARPSGTARFRVSDQAFWSPSDFSNMRWYTRRGSWSAAIRRTAPTARARIRPTAKARGWPPRSGR